MAYGINSLRRIIDKLCWYLRWLRFKRKIPAMPRRLSSAASKFGIRVFGYFAESINSGVQSGGSGILSCLEHLNIPLTTQSVFPVLKDPFHPEPVTVQSDFLINLFHVNADQTRYLFHNLSPRAFLGHHNIGYWFWEVEQFPVKWRDSFNCMQEIWTSSQFTRESLLKTSPIPVFVIPPAVHMQSSSKSRRDFNLPKPPVFIFLFVFDFLSYFERKNPLALVRAFRQAFGDDPQVQLVIQCHNGERFPGQLNQLYSSANQSNIQIIHQKLSREDACGLIALCDAYVSLHCAEGFGFTIAEAMLLEKPVLATAYSGNMEFTNDQNSYLIKCDLVKLKQNAGPYQKGMVWAHPDIDEAARWMRFVYQNRDAALLKAKRAANDIKTRFGVTAVANRIRDRLEKIRSEYRVHIKD